MTTYLKMKCPSCGHSNVFEVEKIFVNSDDPDPKIQVFLPAYLPIKEEKCSQCGQVMAGPRKIIKTTRKIQKPT